MKTPTFRRQVVIISFINFFFFSTPNSIFASQVLDQIKATIEGVMEVVANYKDDRDTRRRLIRDLIEKRFSFEQMSMRSLSKNWKNISADEQKAFVQLFSKLLENSYVKKIESARKNNVDYKGEKIKGKYALIKTEITRNTGPVKVDYKLIQLDKEWKVYDVVIEGVSLVKNYRSQFNQIIHHQSYDALKKKIIVRIGEIESEQNVSDEL